MTTEFTWRGTPDPEMMGKIRARATELGYDRTLKEAGQLTYWEEDVLSWLGLEGNVHTRAFCPNVQYRFVFNPPLVKEPKMNPVDKVVESLSDVNAVLNERGSRYGKFSDHADITQTLKQSADHFLKIKHNTDLKNKLLPYQLEALDMIFHKIGRILNGDPNYVDSWQDISGYAELVVRELEGRGL